MELIVRPENNPQTRLFIFKGAEASFPLAPGQQRIFYSNDIIRANPGQKMLSPEDAEKRGYFLAYNLVRDSRFEGMETKIHSVTAETIQLKSGLIDMMSVTLKTGYSWDENGFERIITNQIRTNFINRGIPPYRSPDAGLSSEQVVSKINTWIKTAHESRDERLVVFKTIKDDEGSILAVNFEAATGTLFMDFKGDCKSNCRVKDNSMTKMSASGAIRHYHPEVLRIAFPS